MPRKSGKATASKAKEEAQKDTKKKPEKGEKEVAVTRE